MVRNILISSVSMYRRLPVDVADLLNTKQRQILFHKESKAMVKKSQVCLLPFIVLVSHTLLFTYVKSGTVFYQVCDSNIVAHYIRSKY